MSYHPSRICPSISARGFSKTPLLLARIYPSMTLSPLTHKEPPSVMPSTFFSLYSSPGSNLPTLFFALLASVFTERTGEVSVAPYPSIISTPNFSFQVLAVDSRSFSAPSITSRVLQKS